MVEEKSKLERTVTTQPQFITFQVINMREHKYKEFNSKAKLNGMDYPSYMSYLMKCEELVENVINKNNDIKEKVN